MSNERREVQLLQTFYADYVTIYDERKPAVDPVSLVRQLSRLGGVFQTSTMPCTLTGLLGIRKLLTSNRNRRCNRNERNPMDRWDFIHDQQDRLLQLFWFVNSGVQYRVPGCVSSIIQNIVLSYSLNEDADGIPSFISPKTPALLLYLQPNIHVRRDSRFCCAPWNIVFFILIFLLLLTFQVEATSYNYMFTKYIEVLLVSVDTLGKENVYQKDTYTVASDIRGLAIRLCFLLLATKGRDGLIVHPIEDILAPIIVNVFEAG